MDFDTFIGQGWDEHVKDPAGVAARLHSEGIALLTDAAQIVPLAHMAHHVMGEHLGQWQMGLRFQEQLAALPLCPPGGAAAQALRRFMASLQLASGAADEDATLSASDRIRVTAMAAASLCDHDTARAKQLFQDALVRADTAALPDSDPVNRALAISGNNLASTLEEKPQRNAEERALMILAAQTARHYWAIAGGWLETERAEYRLAMTWVQASDSAQALVHAQNCLAIVQANDAPPLERFFAWEAKGVAARAAGDLSGHQQALAQVREACAALTEADRGWCQASLDKLAG